MKSIYERILGIPDVTDLDKNECWESVLTPATQGYPSIRMQRKGVCTIRPAWAVVYETYFGVRPEPYAPTLCGNRLCVNPWHHEKAAR